MLFNSIEFAIFLALVLLAYFVVVPRGAWGTRKRVLVVASFLFYMSWNPLFGLLLLFSTLLDFTLGRLIARTESPGRRRTMVALSVAANLGVLCLFKYGQFLGDTLASVVSAMGHEVRFPRLDVALPPGISFYTFESLAYVIDVYRGMPPAVRLLDFALFLSFFPHLVAGPIVRPGMFLAQLGRAPRIDPVAVELALARIATGFVKKVGFADTLGGYVDLAFSDPAGMPGINLLVAVYAYAFQIYFDFSGYSDIALGVAALFGFVLPENFDRPYLATSPREFWQRWHISLSTWLRDYLYVPLGGNRGRRVRTAWNLFVTMVLGGLWHGAAWTFVAWGAYHGTLLVAQRFWPASVGAPSRLGIAARRAGTFHLVLLGWIIFRAPSLGVARDVLAGIARGGFVPSRQAVVALVLVAVAVLLHHAPPADAIRRRFTRVPPFMQGLAYATATVVVFLCAPASARFIYFQF
jgi:D-alanyl-lipoteichoic acid acyltransferase DltB (MBOAT superfamily)